MRCDGWTRAVRAFVFARLLRGERGFAGGGADFVAHLHQRVVRVHLHVRTRRAPAVERAPFARDDAGHDRDLRVARGGDGVGGNWEDDFDFVKELGSTTLNIIKETVSNKKDLDWTEEEKEQQLIKRGRYVEFNLIWDRGTLFGLKTGGSTEAILMSMPPSAKWK